MSSPSSFAICAVLLAGAPAMRIDPGQARGRAREVLKASRCDKCHDSSVDADHPKALAVYDLSRGEWPATMTDAQLPRLLSRLKSAAAKDKRVVEDFIRTELDGRAAQRR